MFLRFKGERAGQSRDGGGGSGGADEFEHVLAEEVGGERLWGVGSPSHDAFAEQVWRHDGARIEDGVGGVPETRYLPCHGVETSVRGGATIEGPDA